MKKVDIDTPALLLDLGIFERNIRHMAQYVKKINTNLRPHVKSHKTPAIAKRQVEAGAIGITCAKLGEAEVMAEAGMDNILIANQIVGDVKIQRLMNLVRQRKVIVAVTNQENARVLSDASVKSGIQLGVILEVETGMERCGIQHGLPALTLAKNVTQLQGLKFLGIMGYEGHAIGTKDFEERKKKALESNRLLTGTAALLRENGLSVEIVSAGATGTFDITGEYPGITEIQAGSYCLMDSDYAKFKNAGSRFQCAVTILTQVVDRPAAKKIVVDAGLKTMSTDQGIPLPKVDYLKVLELHEEHTCLEIKDPQKEIKVGEKIEFVPTHICTTVNLYDIFYCLRGKQVEDVWKISARGKSQ